MDKSYKYRAFITYAHKDENQARWLRKKLEKFSVPKNLVGKKVNSEKSLPVFTQSLEIVMNCLVLHNSDLL